MKLVRWGEKGRERFGIQLEGRVADLSGSGAIKDRTALTESWFSAIRKIDVEALPSAPEGARIGACIPRPGTLLCIGLNYSDHAAEAGMDIPSEPIMFMKATNSCVGPFDDLPMPKGTSKLDWEVELGIVIGKSGFNINAASALDHVAGYCVVNDVSARDWQLEGTGQWMKGKSFPGAAPTGPWLVTADEIDDPQNLSMALSVDGTQRQSGSTKTMIFDVATIIAEASRYMCLEPGDLIATGTPPGVGMGHKPPVFLTKNQVMRAEIEGLGAQEVRITTSHS